VTTNVARHDADHRREDGGEAAVADQLLLVFRQREVCLATERAGDHAEQDQRDQPEEQAEVRAGRSHLAKL
jgi:hypothetical protein